MALAARWFGIVALVLAIGGLVLWIAPASLAAMGLDWSRVIEDYHTLQECQRQDDLLDPQIARVQQAIETRAEATEHLLQGQISFARAAGQFQKAAAIQAGSAQATELASAVPITEEICREIIVQVKASLVYHPESHADELLKRLQREAAELLDGPCLQAR